MMDIDDFDDVDPEALEGWNEEMIRLHTRAMELDADMRVYCRKLDRQYKWGFVLLLLQFALMGYWLARAVHAWH